MAKNGLIYARLSPRDGDSEAALERMVRELEAFARAEGIPVAEVIPEKDTSAWTADGAVRKGRWPEVMDGLRSGRWDALIVRSLDRTTRDVVETLNLLRLYGRGGWAFRALNGDSLDDPKSASVKGLVSQWESDEKSFRLKLKWADKAARGEYHPGRWRPFGYQYAPGSRMPIVDPAEAEIVREVARRIAAGEGLQPIVLDLERRGISSVSGGPWQRAAVIRLVKPAVAGLVEHKGETMPGNWEPILTMDEYLAARAIIDGGKGSRPVGHNTRKHLLSGLVLCGRCGVSLHCNGRVYQCSQKATRAGVRGCGTVSITKHKVEGWIVELAREHLSRADLVVEEDVDSSGWGARLAEAESEVAEIQRAYEAAEIGAADWVRGLRVARERLTEVQAGRLEAVAAAGSRPPGAWSAEHWESMNLSQRRAILGKMMEAIVIKPSGRIGPHPGVARVEVVWRVQQSAADTPQKAVAPMPGSPRSTPRASATADRVDR